MRFPQLVFLHDPGRDAVIFQRVLPPLLLSSVLLPNDLLPADAFLLLLPDDRHAGPPHGPCGSCHDALSHAHGQPSLNPLRNA